MSSPIVSLNDGNEFPLLGLGCAIWPTPNEKEDKLKVEEAVYVAIKAGYRHLDTAWKYGTEVYVGKGVKRAIDEGIVKREDLFITTKVCATMLHKDRVIPSVKESLDRLGTPYVDLLLVHWPVPCVVGPEDSTFLFDAEGRITLDYETDIYTDTWGQMEKAKRDGLTKSIGVSNYNVEQIKKQLENCTIKPAVNQVECTPCLPQVELKQLCDQHGIFLTAYSAFGGQLRFEGGKLVPTGVADRLNNNPIIKGLAEKYNKSVPQILIKFQLDRKVSVIPKSITPERIHQNFEVFDFTLTPEEISSMESMADGSRTIYPEKFSHSPNFPFEKPVQ